MIFFIKFIFIDLQQCWSKELLFARKVSRIGAVTNQAYFFTTPETWLLTDGRSRDVQDYCCGKYSRILKIRKSRKFKVLGTRGFILNYQ